EAPLTSPVAIPPLPAGDCRQPPRFVFAEGPLSPEQSYAAGTTLRYSCRPGYTMARDKSPVVTCLPTSAWSADPDFCIRKSCSPPDINNGNFNYSSELVLGTTITYMCNVGYRLIGEASAQCRLESNNEVSWSHIPYCDIIRCLPPPAIKNGQPINGNKQFTFGMAVTYSCNRGFSLIGETTIHCTMNDKLEGVWSSPAPECKVVSCENPEVKNGGRSSGFGTQHTYKDTVLFECNPGYVLNGSSVVTCEADSTWKPPLPTCDPVRCGPAPSFPFAELTGAVGDSSPAGTQLRYQCKPGYTAARGKSSVVTCQSDKTWSADPDFCIRQQCTPPTVENGIVIADDFLFETDVTFACQRGYELKGSPSAKCVVSGDGVGWDTAPPHCEKQRSDVLCAQPPSINNGTHNGTGGTAFVSGSVVVYKCEDGFTLATAASIRCEANDQHHGVWSKPTPECRGDRLLCLSCCLLSVFKIHAASF
ncbi:C4BPA protein, partial [Urocolius indicus]|nr:C4BPA protein [Urocolius indicus]